MNVTRNLRLAKYQQCFGFPSRRSCRQIGQKSGLTHQHYHWLQNPDTISSSCFRTRSRKSWRPVFFLFGRTKNRDPLSSVMKFRSPDPLQTIVSLTQQIVELRHRQREALKSATFFGITPEESKSIRARRTELNDLKERLGQRLESMWASNPRS